MRIIEKFKKNYFLLFGTFLFIYIFFNLLDGERGLISYFEKKDKLSILENTKKDLNIKINLLEERILLLTENPIDLDYIEILLRKKLFYGKEGEIVYLIQND